MADAENDGELEGQATIRKFRIVQTEGLRQVNQEVIHYNLQAIIAAGFKVNNDCGSKSANPQE